MAPKAIESWPIIEKILESGVKRVLLYGPPGTGKTTAGNKVGIKNEDDVYNITLTEETPAAELRGFYQIVKGDFVWVDGPATRAFREGKRLILNEIDHASGDTHTFLLNLLDDFDIARITLPTGETVHPHKSFGCVATMNGHPSDLPVALRDRFSVSVHITHAHPKAIAALPKDLQGVATKTDRSKDEVRRISPRSWFAFNECREVGLTESDAAFAVFGSDRSGDILDALKLERASDMT